MSLLSPPSTFTSSCRPSPPFIAKLPTRVLVGSKPPAGRASGIVIAMLANVRLSVGRLAMSPDVTTPPISERVVSMSGAALVTVTASVSAPTCRSSSTVGRPPTDDVLHGRLAGIR